MTTSITLHQQCYTSVPRGVRAAFGWQTLARSLAFDKVSLVQIHCGYEVPRLPRTRTDEQMPIDYGFRYLDETYACIFRTCFAGVDGEGRKGNYFVHSFVLTRQDLDAIDADVPALFGWVLHNRKVYSHFSEIVDRYKDTNYVMETLGINVSELKAWRKQRFLWPLVDWLKSFPLERRAQIAREALCVALAPSKARRPVVWVDLQNGMDNSQQQLDVLNFLFAALPFAWRRLATFSTYRKFFNLAGCQWYGTIIEDRSTISEEQRRYEYYVINCAQPSASSELPAANVHPWIALILKNLERPWGNTDVGIISTLASAFSPVSDDDTYDSNGLLARASACHEVLQKAQGDIPGMLRFVDDARPDHPEVLDMVHDFLDRYPVKEKSRAEPLLMSLGQTYFRLAVEKNHASLEFDGRRDALTRTFRRLLSRAYDWRLPGAVKPFLASLHSHLSLAFLRERLMPKFLEQIIDNATRKFSEESLDNVLTLFEPYFAKAPAGNHEKQRFYNRMREALCKNPEKLSDTFLSAASTKIWPCCKDHEPANASELQDTMQLLNTACARGGQNLLPAYLERACSRISAPESVLASVRGPYRFLLLVFASTWRGVAAKLPEAWQNLLREVSGAVLWSCFWEHPPPIEPSLMCGELIELLNEAPEPLQLDLFCESYLSVGAERIDAVLSSLVMSGVGRSDHCYLLALTKVLATICDRPSASVERIRGQLQRLMVLVSNEGNTFPPEFRSNLLCQIAGLLAKLCPTVEDRWQFYLTLLSIAFQQMTKASSEASMDWKAEWKKAVGDAVKDEGEGHWLSVILTQPKASGGQLWSSLVRRCYSSRESPFMDRVRQMALGQLDFQKRLRFEIVQRISEKPRNLAAWVNPGYFGAWLLTHTFTPDPTEAGKAAMDLLDWTNLARLSDSAKDAAVRERLRLPLKSAFERFLLELAEGHSRFPLDNWQEIMIILREVPAKNPGLIKPICDFFEQGVHSVFNWPEALEPLGIACQVELATWFFALKQAPNGFWSWFLETVHQLSKNSAIAALACLNQQETSLSDNRFCQWHLGIRTQLAAWMWAKTKTSRFAAFLAKVGLHGDENHVASSKLGCATAGWALATYLASSSNPRWEETAAHADNWERRLDMLLDQKDGGWDLIYKERDLKNGKNWETFTAKLGERLEGTSIDLQQVVKKLKKRTILWPFG